MFHLLVKNSKRRSGQHWLKASVKFLGRKFGEVDSLDHDIARCDGVQSPTASTCSCAHLVFPVVYLQLF